MGRPWYNIIRTEENDELFQDEEVEKAIEEADESWLANLRAKGGFREVERPSS